MSAGATVAGVALAAGAAACFDGAVAWQALEARAVPVVSHGRLLAALLRRPRWLAASALAALGWPLQLAALSLAPLALVQPTLAFGLVVLLGLGSRRLGERVGAMELGGAAAVIVGVAILAVAAPERSTVTAGAATVAVVVGLLGAGAALGWLARGGLLAAVGAGSAFAGTGLTSKLLSDALARGSAGAVVLWAVATLALALLGTTNDMAAMQALPATRVAPAILVAEVVVPVLLGPVVTGEALGGFGVIAGLVVVSGGVLPLAQASARTESAAAGNAE